MAHVCPQTFAIISHTHNSPQISDIAATSHPHNSTHILIFPTKRHLQGSPHLDKWVDTYGTYTKISRDYCPNLRGNRNKPITLGILKF
jgi:hypothetical protein